MKDKKQKKQSFKMT